MKIIKIAVFCIFPFILQGCLTAFAGANAGLNSNFLDKIIPNPNYAEKKKRELEKDKMLFQCDDESIPVVSICNGEPIYVRDCDILTYRSVRLSYICEYVNEAKTLHYYVDATKEDGTAVKRYVKDIIIQ